MDKNVSWAREEILGDDLVAPRLLRQIELGGSRGKGLGRAYERGNVAAFLYAAEHVPNDAELVPDLLFIASCLRKLYRAQDMGLQPGSVPPETVALDQIVSGKDPSRAGSRGQGRGLSAKERRIVEKHAMELAKRHLTAAGYKVTDRSAARPYDLEAEKDGARLQLEVKGTTGRGESILLTAGEVRSQRTAHPNNGLIIVHSIELILREQEPAARGGILIAITPWEILEDALDRVAYSYRVSARSEASQS